MSVPVYRREESRVEFLNNFWKLRKEMIFILLRDFGIKQKTYTLHFLEKSYEMDPDDRATLEALADKYSMKASAVDIYPEWIVNAWRTEIMAMLNSIGVEIELANNIFITQDNKEVNNRLYLERRTHWTNAISYCNALKDKLQEILYCIDVKTGAYEEVGKKLNREIQLLKAVRKSDNNKLIK